jgi:riboflavin synthase
VFSGIVEQKAPIVSILQGNKIQIRNPFSDVVLGESIALNGVCLTVSEPPCEVLTFYISPETFQKTHFSSLKPGSLVNLERALKVSDRLSGHIVQGHVDGVGTIVAIEKCKQSYRVKIQLPKALLRYCVSKGSIALNGVSLTINDLNDETQTIELMIIPHTWNVTTFSELKPKDTVNVEVDVLAKYMERLCNPLLKKA